MNAGELIATKQVPYNVLGEQVRDRRHISL
jgi:hypothetical protein